MKPDLLTPSAIRLNYNAVSSRSTIPREHVLSQQLVDALKALGLSTSIATHREALARSTPLQAMSATISVICLSWKMPCPQYVRAALSGRQVYWEQQMVRRCLTRLLGWRVTMPKEYSHALQYGLMPIMPDELERATLLDQSGYLAVCLSRLGMTASQNKYQTPT